MELSNNHGLTMTIIADDRTISIRKDEDTYTFEYNLINGRDATNEEGLQVFKFGIAPDNAYDQGIRVFSRLEIGYEPDTRYLTLSAVYIESQPIYLKGTFDCSHDEWDELVATISPRVVWGKW